jgi:DNA mismatch repair protein MutH
VGTSFVWCPNDDEERVLRTDWEDLADIVANGLGFAVTARRGVALQLRPKAALLSPK